MTAAALSATHSHTPHPSTPQSTALYLGTVSTIKYWTNPCICVGVHDVRLLDFIGQVQHIVKTHHRVRYQVHE